MGISPCMRLEGAGERVLANCERIVEGQPIEVLPDELFRDSVCPFLSLADLLSGLKVCRKWNGYIKDPEVWKRGYCQNYVFGPECWKRYFHIDLQGEPEDLTLDERFAVLKHYFSIRPERETISGVMKRAWAIAKNALGLEKVERTYNANRFLVYIPTNLGDGPLSLIRFFEHVPCCSQFSDQGKATVGRKIEKGGYWAVFSREVLQSTSSKQGHSADVLEEYTRNYRNPTPIEATIAYAAFNVLTGKRLHKAKDIAFCVRENKIVALSRYALGSGVELFSPALLYDFPSESFSKAVGELPTYDVNLAAHRKDTEA